MFEIREYRPETDSADVRTCLVELQDFERALEPALLAGDARAVSDAGRQCWRSA